MPAYLTNNVRAGELRIPITIYGPPVGPQGKPQRDAMNAIVASAAMVAVASVNARVEASSGQARYATEQYVDRMSHVITIRYQDGIAKGMEVRFGTRRFTVKYSLDVEERHRWLHLLCMEVGL